LNQVLLHVPLQLHPPYSINEINPATGQRIEEKISSSTETGQ
jgi:hypothetical protein